MPRLVRFYGGDPWRWLAELPLGIVRACARMLPTLEAEEAFAALAVRTGSLKEDGFNGFLRRWNKAIESMRGPAARPHPTQLAAAGIGFRRVPKVARG